MKALIFKNVKAGTATLLFILAGLAARPAFAQLPNTDIWLLDVDAQKDTIILSNPVNITSRPGYDNQPSFSPDGKFIYYTSIRDEKQSDIYRYDLKTKQTLQFTNTPATSEYSPNVTPDGKNISVVMVEPDSTQRLWQFPLSGAPPQLVMDKVDSIGYYCWISEDSLALVMITEPPRIKVVNTNVQKVNDFRKFSDKSIAGRCLVYDKQSAALFYATRRADSNHKEYRINNSIHDILPKKREVCAIDPLPDSPEDFAIIYYSRKNVPPCYVYGYQSCLFVLDWYWQSTDIFSIELSSYGIRNITRIAISPDSKKMAIVAE